MRSHSSIVKMKNHGRQSLILFSIILMGICIFSLFFYVIRSTVPEFNQYHLVRTYPSNVFESRKVRTILLWNDFFENKRWSLPDDTLGPSHFRDELRCPVYQCQLSNNHDFLSSIDMYDAIVFHTAEPFPLFRSIPTKRSTKQLYVFALMEPPGETKHILNEDNFYNLTMTYRLDSDIVWSYKAIADIETGAIVAPAKYPSWRLPPASWNDSDVWEHWSSKTNDIAWFVSHCPTLSQRENLAAALQQYINVDIYGKCGTKSCQRYVDDCDGLLDSTYKFYLSFENSLCTDYVTEKLYNALNRSIIPVVFGGAIYKRFAPPHSYIDAESFQNVQALALYLKYVGSNPAVYMRYFWWRHYYELVNPPSPFCDLCAKLHNQNYQDKIQVYEHIEKWWIGGSCRFKPIIEF